MEIERTVNKVILDGIITSEPQVRYVSYDWIEARFVLQTTELIPQPDGQVRELNLWHKIVARATVAQEIEQFAKLGCRIRLEGSLRYVRNINRQGESPLTTEIECLEFTVWRISEEQDKNEDLTAIVAPEELDWLNWQGDAGDEPF